jgi:ATP-dependent HslUV protease ATP-binding subunit HslU
MLKFARNLRNLPSCSQFLHARWFSEVPQTEQKQEEFTSDMTPKKIVEYLDKFIIGQQDAKKAMAIALSISSNWSNLAGNRWRRKKLPEELKEEIYPKNILMVGPTGCGKTEVNTPILFISDCPKTRKDERCSIHKSRSNKEIFFWIKATKYTEVGYHGRDVDDIIKDLASTTVKQFKNNMTKEIDKRKKEVKKTLMSLILDGWDNKWPNFTLLTWS